jgi:fluoroacetyl-CoA thioesterase
VGTAINLTHEAATPPGLTVTVRVKLESVEGRKLTFSISADDGINKISEGTHERFIIIASKFNEKVKAKPQKGQVGILIDKEGKKSVKLDMVPTHIKRL